jgi:DNA-binding beta-propeller fold protein YncE
MLKRTLYCLASIFLASCGATQWPATPVTFDLRAAAVRPPVPEGSWMAPGARKLDLLYVSDYATNDVDAYSYPQGKLSGVLSGILKNSPRPPGLCADKAGNVFVPDSSNSSVREYAHGSTRLIKILADPDELPYSCAVDPTNGNLAVVNFESISGQGGVSIYAHERGEPQIYSYGFVYKYYFAGYDDKGDLFVDGTDDIPSQPFAFVELRKGSRSMIGITVTQPIRKPGGVGWDGQHVVVDDSRLSIVYRLEFVGSAARSVGSTRLRPGNFIAQFLFGDREIIGADFRGASVTFWKYPSGGTPVKTIRGLGEPFGVTLSSAR